MPFYRLNGIAPLLPPEGLCWIAPNASVIGNVALEENTSVWFGAVLRGDIAKISIGARTNIQDNAVLHVDRNMPLTIGPDCTIGHGAIVHGCTIGENSLIGMGATVLSGAVIGCNCLVGAHALVKEGAQFPDNSLILGAPARVVRVLDEEAVARLTQSALSYVENWKRFADGLQVVE